MQYYLHGQLVKIWINRNSGGAWPGSTTRHGLPPVPPPGREQSAFISFVFYVLTKGSGYDRAMHTHFVVGRYLKLWTLQLSRAWASCCLPLVQAHTFLNVVAIFFSFDLLCYCSHVFMHIYFARSSFGFGCTARVCDFLPSCKSCPEEESGKSNHEVIPPLIASSTPHFTAISFSSSPHLP